jgi:hypothetical protein
MTAELGVIPETSTSDILKGTTPVIVMPVPDDAMTGMPGNIMHIINKIKQTRDTHRLIFILWFFINYRSCLN